MQKLLADLEAARAEAKAAEASVVELRAAQEAALAAGRRAADTLSFDEATTRRRLIDSMLAEAGWHIGENGANTEEVGQEIEVDDQPTDTGKGYIDYVLYDDNGKPLGIVEAKKTAVDPQVGRTQAKCYADGLAKKHGQRPIIFYTNGYDVWIWNDAQNEPPRKVYGLYSKGSLQYRHFQGREREPHLDRMTQSEVMALMTGGMATIAGGVMAAYVAFLNKAGMGDAAGHLLAASVMSAPASLVIAKIMVPETAESETRGHVRMKLDREGANLLDAICIGASDGMKLSLNVMAMLIAFIALVFFLNSTMRGIGSLCGVADLSFDRLLGMLCRTLALAMGVSWQDSGRVGTVLGERTILNEFVAYLDLAKMLKNGEISPRSGIIATYALCGFANFSSIAIQIGGIGGLAPRRRADLARFGLRAMIGGTLASFMTANIAGALLG